MWREEADLFFFSNALPLYCVCARVCVPVCARVCAQKDAKSAVLKMHTGQP